ncbi:MAG: hypothetical protein ACLP1X_15725 [Polyangiaceae bacterium]
MANTRSACVRDAELLPEGSQLPDCVNVQLCPGALRIIASPRRAPRVCL